MSEPANDPPLVTRPEPEAAPPAPAPARPRPGFVEAVLWCLVFVATQMFGAVVAVAVVFTAYALAAADPGKFADEQLAGFSKAVDPKAEGERPPVPFEIGQSLAWGMLAAQFVSLGLIAVVVPRRIGADWKRQIGFRRPSGLHVLLVLLLVPGFMLSSDFIQNVFLALTGVKTPPALKALNSVFGQFPWPLTVLAVALGPGVVEELWCRGFLGRGLCARYGIALGVLLTSVLFSAMHLDPAQLVVITFMGAYLHFVYLATRSIWAPILLHAANNGTAIFIALVVKPPDTVTIPLVVHLATLGLMVFGSVALWTGRAELDPIRGAGEPWQPESPGVSEPPPVANVTPSYAAVSPMAVVLAAVSSAVLVFLVIRFVR